MRALRLFPLFVAAGCDGGNGLATHDGIAAAQICAMDDLANLLRSIRDRRGIEVARPMIMGIASRMEEAVTAAEQLGEPSAVEKERLGKMVEAASKRLDTRIDEAAGALRHDPEAILNLIMLTTEVTSRRVRWSLH